MMFKQGPILPRRSRENRLHPNYTQAGNRLLTQVKCAWVKYLLQGILVFVLP